MDEAGRHSPSRSPPHSARRRKWIASLGIAVATVAGALAGDAHAATSTQTFGAVADAYVNQARPSTNFGAAGELVVRASPVRRSYVRFDVAGLSGVVTRAVLRVSTSSRSTVGFEVRSVADDSWGETTITYANAPTAAQAVTGTSGSFASGTSVDADVTPLVAVDGPVSVALTTPSSTAIELASRERGRRPSLCSWSRRPRSRP
jgi:hypothetical protein